MSRRKRNIKKYEIRNIIYIFEDKEYNTDDVEKVIRDSVQNGQLNFDNVTKLIDLCEILQYMKSFVIENNQLKCNLDNFRVTGENIESIKSIDLNEKCDSGKFHIVGSISELRHDVPEYEYRGDDYDFECGYNVYEYFEMGSYDPISMTLTLYDRVKSLGYYDPWRE